MEQDEIKIGKAEDLRGKTFGFLKVLYRTKNIGKHTAWKCKCTRDGNLINVRVDHLKEGRVVSCGCYAKEVAAKNIIKSNHKGKNAKDITGMKSGFLIALEPTEKRIKYGEKSSHVVWKCQCLNPEHKTPVYCEATTMQITHKNKNSCGCIKSVGEAKIIELLCENNIPFEKEKSFKECKSTYKPYRFDFYVNNKYLIEYDGIQHFNSENHGWNNNNTLAQNQFNDKVKNNWCKENNIPLIRIPYTHLQNLCIEDLLLETSKFII